MRINKNYLGKETINNLFWKGGILLIGSFYSGK